jgi:hypothetical protein
MESQKQYVEFRKFKMIADKLDSSFETFTNDLSDLKKESEDYADKKEIESLKKEISKLKTKMKDFATKKNLEKIDKKLKR